ATGLAQVVAKRQPCVARCAVPWKKESYSSPLPTDPVQERPLGRPPIHTSSPPPPPPFGEPNHHAEVQARDAPGADGTRDGGPHLLRGLRRPLRHRARRPQGGGPLPGAGRAGRAASAVVRPDRADDGRDVLRLPARGGEDLYFVNEMFGPYVGWLHGAFNAVSNVFDVATLPAMALAYIKQLGFSFADEAAALIPCLMILAACLLNIRGIEFVGAASFAFTLIVCSPFAVLALWGARGLPGLVEERFHTGTLSPLKFLSCLLWNMSGYDDAGSTAAEIVNPRKVYPISLAIAMSIITSCYVVPVLVGLTVLPSTDDWHDGSFVLISTRVGGSALGAAVASFGALSSLGQLNALLCSSVREIVCMADLPRQPVPRCLGSLHPRYLTPHVCTVAFSCLLFLLVGVEFTDLIAASMFFDCFSFVVQFAAWVRHRSTSHEGYARVEDDSVYRAPCGLAGVVVISAFPVALCVAAVSLTFRDQGLRGLAGFGGTFAVSTLLYSLQQARGS
ncbi:unnamed protein product, partial [Prorocentrum cordatum]